MSRARAAKATSEVVAVIDGAARGNPGPAAYGIVFKDAAGKVLARLKGRLGETTNNVAEWRALLAALTYAREQARRGRQGWRRVKIVTDSELLARQLTGAYRVRSADLKPLHEEASLLIAGLESFKVEAVRRQLTREADRLANAALDPRLRPAGFGGASRRPVPGDPSVTLRASRRPVKKTPRPVAPATGRQTFRAVYQAGVLKLPEPLGLVEGEEVEIEIRRKKV